MKTSLNLKLLGLAILTVSSLPAMALESKIEKCLTRTYSAEHLKQNPKQIIKSMSVALKKDKTFVIHATLKDNSPHSAISGGGCIKGHGVLECHLDGDSGHFTLALSAKSATLTVKEYMSLDVWSEGEEDMPTETIALEEGKDNGIYKFNVSPLSACAKN